MGYTAAKLKTFRSKEDPFHTLLSDWGTKSKNDVFKLIVFLEKIKRDDLVGGLEAQANFCLFKSIFSNDKISSNVFRRGTKIT